MTKNALARMNKSVRVDDGEKKNEEGEENGSFSWTMGVEMSSGILR